MSAAQRCCCRCCAPVATALDRWSRATTTPRPCRRPARAAAALPVRRCSGPPMTRGARLASVARPCEAGQRWSWDGVGFEWLQSGAGDAAAGCRTTRCPACCASRPAAAAALLTGDIGLREARLLGDQPGAPTCCSPRITAARLRRARPGSTRAPGQVLIQSGHLNRFGHPAPGCCSACVSAAYPG